MKWDVTGGDAVALSSDVLAAVDHRMRGSHLLLMSFCQSVYERNFKSSPRDPKTWILLPH